jgi:transposase/DNA-directed RNA polymerase subunit RPC12/RpoP
MERVDLERMIGEGVSVEKIARRVGRHPSTVSYWLEKYGLRSVFADKHAPRGGIPRDRLVELIGQGLSVRKIAVELDRSPTTVKRWMGRYGLRTAQTVRRELFAEARAKGAITVTALCARHGETLFRLRTDQTSYTCMRCRSENVSAIRRRRKARLVHEAGGQCALCGYSRYPGALQFHHVNPSAKVFAVSQRGLCRSLERARAEVKKCVLLCATCHAEVEGGVRDLVA